MGKTTNKNKKRLIYLFCFVAVMMILLCFRTGYIQVVKGEEYKTRAEQQQTKNQVVNADRGTIYDRNGDVLAISATTYSVWARPSNIESDKLDYTVERLAGLLDMDKKEVRKKLTQKSVLVKLKTGLEAQQMEKVRDAKLTGLEIAEGKTRYYPMNTLASQVIGNVSEEGNGLAGLEMQYNNELNGISGRSVQKTDVKGQALSYGPSNYYQAEDGLNVVSTIDAVMQSQAEKAIKAAKKTTKADKVMCMMMDPKTGEILASATTEGYDPNQARTPPDKEEAAEVEKMSSKKQLEYLSKMWRNPLVSDTYEPGSTFKLVTLSAALEEDKNKLSNHFHCSGSYRVGDRVLKCWKYPEAHGDETLKEGVGNSCNPVFIQVGKKLGRDLFYKYLDLFGIMEKTGVDYPGEAQSLVRDKDSLTTVDFATMSYGQGLSVTPIELLTAVSAIGNDGVLLQPRLVKKLTDSDGKTVKEYGTQVVRQAISKKTAEEVKNTMKFVVEESGGKTARVDGYTIGGKTGTAQNESRGLASNTYYASFVGLAPIDNPKAAILVVVDNPKGNVHGSEVAAPIVKEILQSALPYLDVKSKEES